MTHDPARPLDYPIPAPSALEPPAEWADLRDTCPVAHVSLPSGDGAALVTRYSDVKQVLSDPRFSRRLTAEGAARIADNESGGMFSSDLAAAIPDRGEEHLRWRRMVGRWFTARRMAALSPGIRETAERLLDTMVAKGHPADLKADLGFPLPVRVICDLLGVPATDRDRFSYWSDTLLNLTRYSDEEIAAAQSTFHAYMADHIRTRREHPGDDLLSTLITETAEDGSTLSEPELIGTGIGLLVAGHETTANMIGKMVAMLLSDRSRWERVLADRSLIRSTVEESLRFDANFGVGLPRFITEDMELGDTTVSAGTTVMCNMAAANRDEAAFTHADEMVLDRSPNPHLAFGSGAHSCLGQALARTELQVVLSVLLDRLPTLELAVPVEDLEPIDDLAVGGLTTVPVRW